MTPDVLVASLRGVACGETPDEDFIAFLKKHRGEILLDTPRRDPAEILLNHAAVQERYKVCADVFCELEERQIPYAVVKGAVLSETIFGDPFRRVSGDLDILLCRDFLDEAKTVLLRHGFLQGRVGDGDIVPYSRSELLFYTVNSHQAAPFIKKTKNRLCPFVNVDVNVDILWGESGVKTDMKAFLMHTEVKNFFGIPFRSLTEEAAFLALCLHHYKDMNSIFLLSERGLGIGTFAEIYLSLKNGTVCSEKLTALSDAFSVTPYVFYCLWSAYELFGDPLLLPFIKASDSNTGRMLLGTFGLTEDERKKWPVSLAERVCKEDFSLWFDSLLDEEEREKIRVNKKML